MKLKALFFLLYFFTWSRIMAQESFPVKTDKAIHDFGIIKEAEGKVYTAFQIMNTSSVPIRIKKIESSCGCTIPYVSESTIPVNGKVTMRVDYDPVGRPGRFMKSVEVLLEDEHKEYTLFVNVKGVVIEKELLGEYKELPEEEFELFIKPFESFVVSGSDFRFLNEPRLQDFINDLTYEIDRDGFTTVKLEMRLNEKNKDIPVGEDLFVPVKRYLISELEKRKYSKNHIGFAENPVVADNTIPMEFLGIIRLESLERNNDTLTESGFFRKERTNESVQDRYEKRILQDSIAHQKELGTALILNIVNGKLKLEGEAYDQFTRKLIRYCLAHPSINVGIRVESEDQKKAIALSEKTTEKLYKELKANGIGREKVNFSIPNLFPPSSKGERILLSFAPDRSVEITEFIGNSTERDSVIRYLGYDPRIVFQPPYQHLPVFFQPINWKYKNLDTSDVLFKRWVQVIKQELKSGRKMKFLVESSSSQAINRKPSQDLYVARQRANYSRKVMDEIFKEFNGQYSWEENVEMTQGPPYDSRSFNWNFYVRYQYIKIIPIYENPPQKVEIPLFPYIVNFNYNYFEIPANSDIFQHFINRLIPYINQEGYVKLIIESSSSKVPTKAYNSNEVLSFYRAEEAIVKVRKEVRKRGYDPSRVIIIEQRTLVQGPDWKPGMDARSREYERYQYIKIFPEGLMNK